MSRKHFIAIAQAIRENIAEKAQRQVAAVLQGRLFNNLKGI